MGSMRKYLVAASAFKSALRESLHAQSQGCKQNRYDQDGSLSQFFVKLGGHSTSDLHCVGRQAPLFFIFPLLYLLLSLLSLLLFFIIITIIIIIIIIIITIIIIIIIIIIVITLLILSIFYFHFLSLVSYIFSCLHDAVNKDAHIYCELTGDIADLDDLDNRWLALWLLHQHWCYRHCALWATRGSDYTTPRPQWVKAETLKHTACGIECLSWEFTCWKY